MKQIFRKLLSRKGTVNVEEVPSPAPPGPHEVLIRNRVTLISRGTETTQLSHSGLGLASSMAREKGIRSRAKRFFSERGPLETLKRIAAELTRSRPLGYAGAGTVLEAGVEVSGIRPGDRVAHAGGGARRGGFRF